MIIGSLPSKLGGMYRLQELVVSHNSLAGTVPSSLCDISVLTQLEITASASNSLVSCAPECLTTVSSRELPSDIRTNCPSPTDDALCAFIAATNIASIASYTNWQCTTDGYTDTDPCDVPWVGVSCTGDSIGSIAMNSKGIIGKSKVLVYSYNNFNISR